MNIEQYRTQKLKESFFAKKILRIDRMVKSAQLQKGSYLWICNTLEPFGETSNGKEVKTVIRAINRRIKKIDEYIKKISDCLPSAYARLSDSADNLDAQIEHMIKTKIFN